MISADESTIVEVASGPLAGPVLRRVVGIFAARADLPLDRLDDAIMIADALAARTPAYLVGTTLRVALHAIERRLELQVGPLRPGGGDALVSAAELPGVGNLLERLADELAVQRDGDAEYLFARLTC